MNKYCFNLLVDEVIDFKRNLGDPREKYYMFWYNLVNANTYRALTNLFCISKTTICRIVSEMEEVFYSLAEKDILFHNQTELTYLEAGV